MVRALVNWTQTERPRRLAVVLRPFFDRGLDAHEIAAELQGMAVRLRGWRPRRPGDFIEACLAKETERDSRNAAEEDASVAVHESTAALEWQAAREAVRERFADPERTDSDRAHARLYGWTRWEEIADRYADDADDALDLYGHKLCGYAVGKAARLEESGARI